MADPGYSLGVKENLPRSFIGCTPFFLDFSKWRNNEKLITINTQQNIACAVI